MKNLFRTATAAALVSLALSAPAMAQEVTLRFQHFISPKGSIPAGFITPWAERIEAESDGRIKVEIFPNMQLGGAPPALYDQIRDGVVDGGWTIPGYNAGRFPAAEAFELPFMGATDAETTSRAAWEFYEKYLQDEFKDVKVLAVHVHGPTVIHTRNKPVRSLEDMKGLKLRTPTRLASKLLEATGATPIAMPVPAFPENLSKGVVDGGVIPWEIVPPLKVHELATSHTTLGGDRAMYNTMFIFGMNRSTYDGLPDDLKAVIDNNSGVEMSALAGRAMDEGDIPGRQLTEARGNEIIELSDEETARWRALAEPIIADWIEEMNDLGLPGAQMVEDARALVAKHAGGGA